MKHFTSHLTNEFSSQERAIILFVKKETCPRKVDGDLPKVRQAAELGLQLKSSQSPGLHSNSA